MKVINNTLKLALMLIVIMAYSISANAQNYNQEEKFLQRVKERVKLMNDYVSYMASKSYKKDTKKYYLKKSLPLFIGNGYEYEENGVTKKGVTMQTTSVNNDKVKTTLIRDYFKHLVGLPYAIVDIKSTEIADMKVSGLKKVDSYGNKTLYTCTCQYVQYFIGGYKDGYFYKDKTTKRIVCYVETEETEDGQEYMIKLGDVEAIHTEDYNIKE
ncbi:MAG TPA: hypothetical protein IAA88_08725 [Candidatus Avimuribaculum pullicola]|nr:hypothetical protein [Candidatus Avimuribaculum pullicola]